MISYVVMTPVYKMFDPIWSLAYASTGSNQPPLSTENSGLYLSHLVPIIRAPKRLIFHQIVFNHLA